jgi:VanZ family protein
MGILEKEKQLIDGIEQSPKIKKAWHVVLKHDILFFWDPVFVYMGIIIYMSSIPKPLIPGIVYYGISQIVATHQTNYVLHFIEFFMFSFLFSVACRHSKHSIFRSHHYILGLIIGILFGISDEIHQFFVPGRVCALTDIFADSLGAMGSQIFRWILKREKMVLDKVF